MAAKKDVADVKIVSKFPILPPRYVECPKDTFVHNFDSQEINKNSFEVMVQPGGVDIVDVYFE